MESSLPLDNPGLYPDPINVDLLTPVPWLISVPYKEIFGNYTEKFKELLNEQKNKRGGSEDSPDDVAKLIVEVEEVIEAIKNGEMEGEYFEF